MPRESAESLSVAAISIPQRPEPPEDLNEYQAGIWRAVVNTKPVEWFQEDTFPLLRAYVKASDYYERIAREIEQHPIQDCKDLLNIQEKQARLVATLATKMRLTQQSRYTPQAASTADKKAGSGKKPWEK